MSLLSPPPRPHSRASETASVTTYHSFRDAEPHEPETPTAAVKTAVGPYARRASAPPPSGRADNKDATGARGEGWPVTPEIRRQDSGYESLPSRPSRSRRRQNTPTESSSSPPAGASRARKRLPMRRAIKSGSAVSLHLPNSTGYGIYAARSYPPAPPRKRHNTPLHLPHHPDEPSRDGPGGDHVAAGVLDPYDFERPYETAAGAPPAQRPATYPLPPRTTHYWTSDRTRRLEYAAIDAAGRGVRGWVRKHMVPDCFVPKESRRVGFEDDRGSVRRYRIELECEDEKGGDGDDNGAGWWRRRKSWWDIF